MTSIGIGISIGMGGGDPFTAIPFNQGLQARLVPSAGNVTIADTDQIESLLYGAFSFAKASDATRPTYEPAGWATTLHGPRPSVLFVRANADRLVGPSTFADIFEGSNTANTVYCACQLITTPAAGQRLLELENSGDADSLVEYFPSSSSTKIGVHRRADNATAALRASADNASTDKVILSWRYDPVGNLIHTYRNGTLLTYSPDVSTGNVGTITLDRATLGNNNAGTIGLDGRIADQLVYNVTHSVAEHAAIVSWLMGLWL